MGANALSHHTELEAHADKAAATLATCTEHMPRDIARLLAISRRKAATGATVIGHREAATGVTPNG